MSKLDKLEQTIVKEIKSGFLKLVILIILNEENLHGYGIIKKIDMITRHKWTPSSGSIYPALKTLEKHRLIKSKLDKNKKVYTITTEGRKFLKNISVEINDGIKDFQTMLDDSIKNGYNIDR
jgi:DNA-binding PadR family transcriptional regulator